jgi:hypothetical protein
MCKSCWRKKTCQDRQVFGERWDFVLVPSLGNTHFRWRRADLNCRHEAYESPALPTELRRHEVSKLPPSTKTWVERL